MLITIYRSKQRIVDTNCPPTWHYDFEPIPADTLAFFGNPLFVLDGSDGDAPCVLDVPDSWSLTGGKVKTDRGVLYNARQIIALANLYGLSHVSGFALPGMDIRQAPG